MQDLRDRLLDSNMSNCESREVEAFQKNRNFATEFPGPGI